MNVTPPIGGGVSWQASWPGNRAIGYCRSQATTPHPKLCRDRNELAQTQSETAWRVRDEGASSVWVACQCWTACNGAVTCHPASGVRHAGAPRWRWDKDRALGVALQSAIAGAPAWWSRCACAILVCVHIRCVRVCTWCVCLRVLSHVYEDVHVRPH